MESLIKKAYTAFNKRDIDTVLLMMDEAIHWPNGWEGGYISGKEELRDYWTRQWAAINPHVEPLSVTPRADGSMEVLVKQLVKDLDGNILSEGMVKHIYRFTHDRIKSMEIEIV